MKIKDIIEKHAQPNFMIGIGYVKPYCEKLESRIEKLRAALKFYEDEYNWDEQDVSEYRYCESVYYITDSDIEFIVGKGSCGGKTARTALREDRMINGE